MKFFDYLTTLFLPARMGKRKNMSVVISLLILLLAGIVIMIPYIVTLKKDPYKAVLGNKNFEFQVFDASDSSFNKEEKDTFKLIDKEIKLCDSFRDLLNGKEMLFEVKDKRIVNDEDINHKWYVLKRKDKDDNICYLHILFDIFTEENASEADSLPKIKKFNELVRLHPEENHYLLCFYSDSYLHKTIHDAKRMGIPDSYTRDFKFDNLKDFGKVMAEMFIPNIIQQYTYIGFQYATFFSLLFVLLGYLFKQTKKNLVTFKHFLSIGALVTLNLAVLSFCFGWIKYFLWHNAIMFYPLVFIVYYFVCLYVVERKDA